MITDQITYRGYRYAPEIISQAVWLYYRFCLSFRDVEGLLAERGIVDSTIWGTARCNCLPQRTSVICQCAYPPASRRIYQPLAEGNGEVAIVGSLRRCNENHSSISAAL